MLQARPKFCPPRVEDTLSGMLPPGAVEKTSSVPMLGSRIASAFSASASNFSKSASRWARNQRMRCVAVPDEEVFS